MSSTQKKPDNTKRAASGKASGKPAKRATAKSSSAKKGTSARKKPAAYTPDLVSRGIAAAVCIFLALLVALGMFGIHAVVPDLLKKGIQGLIGYGFWMVAFVLLWAAGLLLFRRDRRQTLRLWCLGLLPVVGGALLHILLWPGTYPIDFHLVGRLWTDGVQSMGGGVVSGFLAVVTVKGISRLAAGLVFALLFVILLALAAHVTRGQVSGAVSRARDHHAQRAARREKYPPPPPTLPAKRGVPHPALPSPSGPSPAANGRRTCPWTTRRSSRPSGMRRRPSGEAIAPNRSPQPNPSDQTRGRCSPPTPSSTGRPARRRSRSRSLSPKTISSRTPP